MKYPVVRPKQVITYYNISHTEELTDFEIMELFKQDAKVTVLDYDEDVVDGVPTYFWRVCVELDIK